MTNPCYTSSIPGVCWHEYILYTSTRVYNVVSRISLVNSQYTLLKQTSIPVQSSSSYSECILIFSPSKGSDKSLFRESLISSEWMTMLHVHIHFIRNWFPSMSVNDHILNSPHLPSQSNLPMWFPRDNQQDMAEKKRKADADAAEVPDGTMGVSKVERLEGGWHILFPPGTFESMIFLFPRWDMWSFPGG